MLLPCRKIIYAMLVGGRPGSKHKLVVIQNICVQWWDLGGVGVSVNLLKIDIKKKYLEYGVVMALIYAVTARIFVDFKNKFYLKMNLSSYL